jgi:hypothetical protein
MRLRRKRSQASLAPVLIYPGKIVSVYTRVEKEVVMTQSDRNALTAAYKERKTVAGVFAVICSATGDVWVGRSLHVETHRNGL